MSDHYGGNPERTASVGEAQIVSKFGVAFRKLADSDATNGSPLPSPALIDRRACGCKRRVDIAEVALAVLIAVMWIALGALIAGVVILKIWRSWQ